VREGKRWLCLYIIRSLQRVAIWIPVARVVAGRDRMKQLWIKDDQLKQVTTPLEMRCRVWLAGHTPFAQHQVDYMADDDQDGANYHHQAFNIRPFGGHEFRGEQKGNSNHETSQALPMPVTAEVAWQ